MKPSVKPDKKGEFRWRTTNGGNITATCHEGYTRERDGWRAWWRYCRAMKKYLRTVKIPKC